MDELFPQGFLFGSGHLLQVIAFFRDPYRFGQP